MAVWAHASGVSLREFEVHVDVDLSTDRFLVFPFTGADIEGESIHGDLGLEFGRLGVARPGERKLQRHALVADGQRGVGFEFPRRDLTECAGDETRLGKACTVEKFGAEQGFVAFAVGAVDAGDIDGDIEFCLGQRCRIEVDA